MANECIALPSQSQGRDTGARYTTEAYIGLVNGGSARNRLALQFVHKLSGDGEPLQLTTHFDSTYPANAVQPGRARNPPKSRQHQLNFDLDSHRGAFSCENKQPALAYVHAMAGTIMVGSVFPAEQKRERDLKSQRVSSLDRLSQSHVIFATSVHHIDRAQAAQAGDSPARERPRCAIVRVFSLGTPAQ